MRLFKECCGKSAAALPSECQFFITHYTRSIGLLASFVGTICDACSSNHSLAVDAVETVRMDDVYISSFAIPKLAFLFVRLSGQDLSNQILRAVGRRELPTLASLTCSRI